MNKMKIKYKNIKIRLWIAFDAFDKYMAENPWH